MKIEPLDERTVKIVLSKADMLRFKLTYDEMDYQNPDTKRVILKLIGELRQQYDMDLSQGRLFIEAFPYADGGCILYVNLLDLPEPSAGQKKYRASFDTPLIFCFADLDSLSSLSARLSAQYSHVILKSSLYLLDGMYYLMIYTYFKMDQEITHLLSEYGQFYGKGAVRSSVIQEHAKELIHQNAIRVIEECLY